MRKKVSGIVVFSGMIALVLLGCSSNPVSPQKPWFPIHGDLVWVESANVEVVFQAVLETAKEMGLSVTKQEYDSLAGVVVAKSVDDKRVSIKLQLETAQTTRVSIRVGFWADKKTAKAIYRKIKENL